MITCRVLTNPLFETLRKYTPAFTSCRFICIGRDDFKYAFPTNSLCPNKLTNSIFASGRLRFDTIDKAPFDGFGLTEMLGIILYRKTLLRMSVPQLIEEQI